MKFNNSISTNIFNAILPSGDANKSFINKQGNDLYLGLCEEEPTVNASGTVTNAHEIATASATTARNYSRLKLAPGDLSRQYQSYSLGETSEQSHVYRVGNPEQLAFAEALRSPILSNANSGGMWKTATHWAIWQTATGGLPIVWGELDEPITVDTHEVFIIRKGHMEIYLEPDPEDLYWGLFSSESDFISALNDLWYTDNKGDRRPKPSSPTGLNSIHSADQVTRATELSVEITAGDTSKHLFFASPVDFKGTPMFRKPVNYTTDKDMNGDYIFTDYGFIQSNSIVYTGAYFVGTYESEVDKERIPQSNSGDAPIFGTSGTANNFAPFYDSEGTVLAQEPVDWSANYSNYYYQPRIILVNRENAYFIYEILPGDPQVVVSPVGNPSTQGYFELRNEKVKQFIRSTDTSINSNKVYYNLTSSTWTTGTYPIRVF